MFKHTISELKEALVCLQAGQVTLGYPFTPHSPEPGFRGLPRLNTRKCMACGACANACPSRLISLTDQGTKRKLHFELGRCTYCGNCRDACPQEALSMTMDYELSTLLPADLSIRAEFHLARCRKCGTPIGSQRMLDLVRERLTTTYEAHLADVAFLDMCPECKREASILDQGLMREVVP